MTDAVEDALRCNAKTGAKLVGTQIEPTEKLPNSFPGWGGRLRQAQFERLYGRVDLPHAATTVTSLVTSVSLAEHYNNNATSTLTCVSNSYHYNHCTSVHEDTAAPRSITPFSSRACGRLFPRSRHCRRSISQTKDLIAATCPPALLTRLTMDITLLPPTPILSNHSHITLLPSPFTPSRRLRPYQFSGYAPSSHPRLSASFIPSSTSQRRSIPCPPPPQDGHCIIDSLPDEIICNVLSFLDWNEVLQLRPVSRRWSDLALSPSLHQSISLLSLPPLPLPSSLSKILRNIGHLHLHLFPYPAVTPGSPHPTTALLTLLEAIPPDQLVSLSLPFSAPYLPGPDLGLILQRIGGRLECLDLRGSGLVGSKWTEWIRHVGSKGRGLKSLDLSFTSISTLPGCPAPASPARPFRNPLTLRTATPMSQSRSVGSSAHTPPEEAVDPFRNLKYLSLSSCAYLSEQVLDTFLANLPVSIEQLDISRLEVVSFEALWHLRVLEREGETSQDSWRTLPWNNSPPDPTNLSEVKVVGIDHLTRLDIRRLKSHWESQRQACYPSDPCSPVPIPLMGWKTPITPQSRSAPPSPPATPSPPSRRETMGLSSSTSHESLGYPTPPDDHPFVSRPSHSNGLPTPPPDSPRKQGAEDDMDVDVVGGENRRTEINIVHSAILESEDVDGYRRFIGEVAGGVVPLHPHFVGQGQPQAQAQGL